MSEVPKDVSVMTSHFESVLGVEPAADIETQINAQKIIDAFRSYEGDDLAAQVSELLSRVAAELSLMNLKGLKGLYRFAENDEERDDALTAAGKLKAKLDFFSYLLSQLRDLVVETNTNAHEDRRNLNPQFQEVAGIIQKRMDDYNEQVGEFKKYVLDNP